MAGKEILGIIPARGGSKRIPRKNIIDLCGKPLIYYTINAAINSELISRFIVSTDNKEIAEISKQFGAEVPFLRPKELAEDTSSTLDVLIHAINFLKEQENYHPDIVVILEPTSPLRTSNDIDAGINLHKKYNADSVVGVVKTDHWHPIRAKKISNGILADYCIEEKEIRRRQDLPPAYFRNGAFYSSNVEIIMDGKLYGDKIFPYIMPDYRSIDINSMIDLMLASKIIENKSIDMGY